MSKVEEQRFAAFLLELKKLSSVKEFQQRYRHPFLLREAEIWVYEQVEADRKAVAKKTSRMKNLLGRHSGYVLGMIGESTVESVAKRSADMEARKKIKKLEKTLLHLKPDSGQPRPGDSITVGTDENVDVCLVDELAEGISGRHARFVAGASLDDWYLMDDRSEAGTFLEGAKLSPGQPQRIADADWVRLGPNLEYRFFSAQGMYTYLKFSARLEAAKAKAKKGQGKKT